VEMIKLCKITVKTRRDWGEEGTKRDCLQSIKGSCGGESKAANNVDDEEELQAYGDCGGRKHCLRTVPPPMQTGVKGSSLVQKEHCCFRITRIVTGNQSVI